MGGRPGIPGLTPLLYIGLTRDDDPFLVQGWASTIRIATEFTAGSITYLAVRKWQDSLTAAKAAELFAWIVPAAILVIAVVMGNIDALQWEGLPTRRRAATWSSSRCSSCGWEPWP